MYEAFILSIAPVQLFLINKSRGKERSDMLFVSLLTNPRIITSALFPSIFPRVSATFSDLSSEPMSK